MSESNRDALGGKILWESGVGSARTARWRGLTAHVAPRPDGCWEGVVFHEFRDATVGRTNAVLASSLPAASVAGAMAYCEAFLRYRLLRALVAAMGSRDRDRLARVLALVLAECDGNGADIEGWGAV